MPSSIGAYDAIVVGARCAGAPTAMLLARAGARVLLLDRASFPSDTVSGHAIKPPGVAYLKRWGVLDRVLATGCPPITRVDVSIDGKPMPPMPLPDDLYFLAPRRTLLDTILVEAATAAGADLHERTTVTALEHDGDHVLGVEARTAEGRVLRARAPIVIGADGKQSWVAHQVGAPYTHYAAPVSIAYFTYWSRANVNRLMLEFAPGRVAGIFPTNDDLALAFVQCQWSERHAFRADVTGSYLATLNSFPRIAAALDGAAFDPAIRGMLDLPAFFRHSYGPGWVLAGDAAHHKDPLIARGISDAFRDADLLSRALARGLGGETNLTPALARYQLLREAASRDVSMLNHYLAELPDEPADIEARLSVLMRTEAEADAAFNEAASTAL
jgi:2-polyprenyl-6-methoxyphenol hydroxylase-like FAD-dependent oxidoreductase